MPFRRPSPAGRSGGFSAVIRALIILVLALAVIGGLIAFSITRRGLSAHDVPSRTEEIIAGAMRRWATPGAVRARSNPLSATEEVFQEGLEKYADHCAVCHGNDGGGDTAIGRGLYPRVPDMRSAQTQALTDGELFAIIEHGVGLTGMPGWGTGTPGGERESWALVQFVRRLPQLRAEDLERIQALIPRTPAEFREEEEARRFLQGETSSPPKEIKKGHQD